jgi:energy-coupling factor transporter ATP-binding protein EcfA2
MHALIEADGLSKRFGKVQALNGLDLTIPSGQVVAILGPNGAGKSTFVRTVATLLRPTAVRSGWPAMTSCASPWPSATHRPGRSVGRGRGDDDRPREPGHGGPPLRAEQAGGPGQRRAHPRAW